MGGPTHAQLPVGKSSRRDAKRTGSLAHGVRISSCRIAWTSMVLARSTVSTPQPAALALRAGQKRRRKTELTASQVQTEDGVGESITFIDGDGVGYTITRVH